MKIITWNCNMAFRKKAGYILAHKPDILIVPECENPDKLIFGSDVPAPTDIIWYGTNAHKGLAVFSYNKYRLKLLAGHIPDFKTILPIAVTGGEVDFKLFAIWANNPQDKGFTYVGQIWKAINHYDGLLSSGHIILAGDFNSNTIWDKPKREGNHTTVVNVLARKEIQSAYHQYHGAQQGKEGHPTLYLYRHENKPYHMDYCFASDLLMKRLKQVEIGNHADWARHSDHMPVMVTFAKGNF